MRTRRAASSIAHGLAAAALFVAACAPLGPQKAPASAQAAAQMPAEFPSADYTRAAAQGKLVFRIDPERSLVAITVRRGGSLARLGHDHVVASRSLQGFALPGDGRADLFVPLGDLEVDEPAMRQQAGFDTQPSESDIAGTRANMRDKVLEVDRFPYALVRVRGIETSASTEVRMSIAITLHGVTRSVPLTARTDSRGDEVGVDGVFELRQSDFGIVPFSILGGAVQVQDALSVRFSIRAHRDAGAAAAPST